MLAELSEFGLYTDNRAYLEAILESLSAEGDIAYAVIVDRKGERVAARRIADALGTGGPPATPADAPLPAAGTTTTDGSDDPRPALRRADRAGERHEDRDRDGLDQGPPEPAADATPPRPRPRGRDADRLRPARDDVRPAAAAVQKASRRRAFRHRAPDRAHDRRDVPAHARPRRADASADARGARGRRRQARRVRPGALVGRARARSRTRSTT